MRIPFPFFRGLAAATLLACLAACGGGGGGASAPAPSAPTITGQPQGLTVLTPSPATFTVVATGTAPLAYQWKRNGVDIAGATSASYTTRPPPPRTPAPPSP